MATSASAPAATACSHWARPISPPSLVTMALSDMFWPLNGRHCRRLAGPGRGTARPPTVDLPASDVVPHTINAPFTAAVLSAMAVHIDFTKRHLTRPPVEHTTCGCTPSVARQGGAPEPDRAVCVDARPRVGCRGAAGASAQSSFDLRGVRAHRQRRTTREVTTVAIAEDSRGLAIIHEPEVDDPLHGRATRHRLHLPKPNAGPNHVDLFGMWAGASVQIEYFVYGAILMTFGFTFAQASPHHRARQPVILLLGICSLQGPDAGTTVFGINRASYGPNGSRLISLFNWLTQVGFEVEGLILIVGAACWCSRAKRASTRGRRPRRRSRRDRSGDPVRAACFLDTPRSSGRSVGWSCRSSCCSGCCWRSA